MGLFKGHTRREILSEGIKFDPTAANWVILTDRFVHKQDQEMCMYVCMCVYLQELWKQHNTGKYKYIQ